MERAIVRLADIVSALAIVGMSVLIIRAFWRGYHGAPVRPSRSALIAAAILGAVGIGAAVVAFVA